MPLLTSDLTEADLEGDGVFDVLMRAVDGHVHAEYNKSRIKGGEYSTVYLGAMQAAMQNAVQFLLNKDKADLEATLIQAQIDKITAEIALVNAQKDKILSEQVLVDAQKDKITAEIDVLNQKKLTEQAQTDELIGDPGSVIGKQRSLYQAQADGFTRDAEQKAAGEMLRTWLARRSTDELTSADHINYLNDTNVGLAVEKLMAGIGVTVDPTPPPP